MTTDKRLKSTHKKTNYKIVTTGPGNDLVIQRVLSLSVYCCISSKMFKSQGTISRRNMTNMLASASVFRFGTLIRCILVLFLILSISITVQPQDRNASSNALIMVYAFSSINTVRRAGGHNKPKLKPNDKPMSLSSFQIRTGLVGSNRVTFPIKQKTHTLHARKNSTDKNERQNSIENPPTRPLAPPFPDGLNNGRIVTLPPSEHYLLDTNLSGNTLLLPPRDISVWLPPDYDLHPNMTFPVLYIHDGQNAIRDSSSSPPRRTRSSSSHGGISSTGTRPRRSPRPTRISWRSRSSRSSTRCFGR